MSQPKNMAVGIAIVAVIVSLFAGAVAATAWTDDDRDANVTAPSPSTSVGPTTTSAPQATVAVTEPTTTTTSAPTSTPAPAPTTAAPPSTTTRPATTTKTSTTFEFGTNAPATVTVGTTQTVKVHFRNLGPELEGGFSLESKLVDSTGKAVTVTGTGGLMPTGFLIEDTMSLACAPLPDEAKANPNAVALEGPCAPGVYRIIQTVTHNGGQVAQSTSATIRFS